MATSRTPIFYIATSLKTREALNGWPTFISAALALEAGIASGLTLFVPGVLRGPAVMNGSGRGTALVALIAAVPILIASMLLVSQGAERAVFTWLGALAYLLYNSVLFLFITPFNQLFLLYVAMFTLSFWSLVLVLARLDAASFTANFGHSFPARIFAGYLVLIATLNALAWLANVVPAVASPAAPAFLIGTGLPTNPVYVQDLAFWIPLMLVSSVWLWQRRPLGFVCVGALLVFGVIESVSIAVDQWMGSAADPTSTVASAGLAPVLAVVAAIQLVPLFLFLRRLSPPERT